MRKRQKGFSLIELLIVVAIILIIAAVAIPNLLRDKIAANEVSAVESLRTLTEVCLTYETTYGGYPNTIANLGPGNPATPATADLIDSVLASGSKSGYNFVYAVASSDSNGHVLSYSIAASPVSPGTTGQRYFFTDQSGVIRANATGVASLTSTPIGQ
jgi:type IV pilus assembly protein PilA